MSHPAGPTASPTARLPRVVVVGGANMDLVGQASMPLTAGDSTPGEVRASRGGVGRNMAENLAQLGVPTLLHSAVGSDAWGRRLLHETQACGVDVSRVFQSADWPTAQYLSLVEPGGKLAMALNDMRVLDQLTPAVLRQQGFDISNAACLVLDCNLRPDTLAWLMDVANQGPAQNSHPTWVMVDAVSAVKCQRIKPHLAAIHTLKLNRLEAQALTGLAVDSLAEARMAAAALCQQGVQRTVLSLGELGVCWCDAMGPSGHVPASRVPRGNTNGAGDALLAGVVYGHLAGLTLPQTVEFGMACAELTLTSSTANAPGLTPQTVQAALARRKSSHET